MSEQARNKLQFSELPEGTVTFLFTDIAGSTQLLSQLRDRYAALLADQRRILRTAFARWGGQEVDSQGDAFFVAFSRATQAVCAAVEIQRALNEHDWSEGVQVRIRMGLHTGEPLRAEEGYVGMDVHRAARLAHVGHGGQVLLSETTAALVIDELPEGVELLDLGRHRLKDLRRPEHIRQLLIPGLPTEFPSLMSLEMLPPEIPLDVRQIKLPSFLEDEGGEVSPPVFVGRQSQLQRLDTFLHQALEGGNRVAFIIGGPGRGKTALMEEFARRALLDHPDLLVAVGRCNAYTGLGDPYLPFRNVLSMLTGDIESYWRAGSITREQAQRLWQALPLAARALLDEGQDLIDVFVSGQHLLLQATLSLPVETALIQSLKHRVRSAGLSMGKLEPLALNEQYTRVLRAIAEHSTLLILLDDLQWADEASVNLLFHLIRTPAVSHILILGSYRPEEIVLAHGGRRHPLEKILSEFKSQYGDTWIDLGLSNVDEEMDFVNAFLDTEPNRFSKSFRDTLYHHTAGHPLFTIELLRALQEDGSIIKDAHNFWMEATTLSWDKLPARIEGVIETRIERLDEDLGELLTVAAVEGEQFSVQVLAHILGYPEHQIVEMLVGDLGDRHRLVEEVGAFSIEGRRLYQYRFHHLLFQQYLYQKLSPIRRELLHTRVGAALESIYGMTTEEIAPQLVWHFDQAKDDRKLVKYALRAGDRARKLGASHEAIKYNAQALLAAHRLNGDGSPVKPYLIHERLGDIYLQNLSQHEEALAHYHQFLSMADQEVEKIRAERKIASVYLLTGKLEEAQNYYQSALSSLGQEDVLPDVGMIYCGLAYLSIYKNQLEEGEKYAQTALSKAKAMGEDHCLAEANNALGQIAAYRTDYKKAYEYLKSSLVLYRQIGDLPRIAKICNNMGEICRLLGRMEAAQEFLQEGLTIARRVGDKREQAAVLTTSADVYLDQGRWEDAIQILNEAIPVAQQSGVTVRILEAYWFIGKAYCFSGQMDQARQHLELAKNLCLDAQYLRYLPQVYLELARLELSQSNHKDAKANIQRAVESAGERPGDELLGQIEGFYGYLYHSIQDWGAALAHYEKALEYLERSASPVHAARVQMDLGVTYLNRAQRGDRARAQKHLRSAQSVFQQISAQYYLTLVQAQLEEVESG